MLLNIYLECFSIESLSIYTPVVWIAFEKYLIAYLYMAASLTESVYIYSCCLDRLVSEM